MKKASRAYSNIKHIGLVDADLLCNGTRHPNLALLKIAGYLKENGYTIAIASSKKTDTVKMGLQVSGLEGYFETIVGIEQVYNHKPDKECLIKVLKQVSGEFTNAVYIGDSASDIVCAKNAGCYSIGYTSNKLLVDKLKASQPNALVDDLIEVKDILNQNISFSFNLR